VIVGLTVTYVQVALTGPLVRRHGEARLNIYGLLAVAVGIALIPLAQVFGPAAAVVIVTAAVMLSVGAACVIPTARSLVSRLVPENRQGVMLGSLLALTGIASALGPMLAGVLYDLSPSLCFLLQAAVCLAGAPLLRGVREPALVAVDVGT
jgi:MFS family permease